MQLSEVYSALGAPQFEALLKSVSMGKLKSFQLYDRLKIRLHLNKLSGETLKKAAPRLFERITSPDEELATDLGQAILICNLEMIVDVLNVLEIPHEDGFFSKDLEPAQYLKDGWQGQAYQALKDKYSTALLTFYLSHLSYELEPEPQIFRASA